MRQQSLPIQCWEEHDDSLPPWESCVYFCWVSKPLLADEQGEECYFSKNGEVTYKNKS